MNENLWAMVMKMALFMAIACLVVFFMVTPFTAEWYILIVAMLLDVSVCIFIRIAFKIKEKKENKPSLVKGEKNEIQ